MRRSDNGASTLDQIRRAAVLCSQFGNEVLTANYLLYKYKGDTGVDLERSLLAEAAEATGRYKAWGDRLSSYVRDAVVRKVSGLIKARGREVMRGECSLPTFLRSGAILVRERGVKIWKDEDGRLYCSLKIIPDQEPLIIELWVKGLHAYYGGVLDNLLSGEYEISQAQVLLVRGFKVGIRLAYSMKVTPLTGGAAAEVIKGEGDELSLRIGARSVSFGFDVLEAARRKSAIEARRVQCWRLIRGRRVKKRRARVYRSGALSRISNAWTDYLRTWSQQLASAMVKAALRARCSEIVLPSPAMFETWFIPQLDWTQVHNAIADRAEREGMRVSVVATEREMARKTRKARAV